MLATVASPYPCHFSLHWHKESACFWHRGGAQHCCFLLRQHRESDCCQSPPLPNATKATCPQARSKGSAGQIQPAGHRLRIPALEQLIWYWDTPVSIYSGYFTSGHTELIQRPRYRSNFLHPFPLLKTSPTCTHKAMSLGWEQTYRASRNRERRIITASHVLCLSCIWMELNLRWMMLTIRSISFGEMGRVRLCSRSRFITWVVNSLQAWEGKKHKRNPRIGGSFDSVSKERTYMKQPPHGVAMQPINR